MKPINDSNRFKVEDMYFFHPTAHSAEIRKFARSFTKEEILEYYGCDDINELEPNDREFFEVNFRRGRYDSVDKAVGHLFEHMRSKNGLDAIKYYLSHVDKTWMSPDRLPAGVGALGESNVFQLQLTEASKVA